MPPGRQLGHRLPHRRREAAGENPVPVGQLDVVAALRLPRQERLEDPLRLGQVLVRRGHVAPAVHRAAGDALEDHDLARARGGQRGEDEVLADGRDQVEAHGGVVRPRRHARDVRERERAHRLVVRRTRRVALEQRHDLSLAGRDDDQVVLLRVLLQVVDARVVDDELAALPLQLLHPAGDLHALVDRLRRPVELRRPVDHLAGRRLHAGRRRHGERDALDRRALFLPEVEPELALALQRRVEHALARHHLAVVDVLRGAVRDDGDLVSLLQKPQRELESRLARTDDQNAAHWLVSSVLVIPPAWGSPARPARGPSPSSRRRPRSRRR